MVVHFASTLPSKRKNKLCKHRDPCRHTNTHSRQNPIIFTHNKRERVKLVLGLGSIFIDWNIRSRGKHPPSQFLTDPRHKAKCRLFRKTTTPCHQSSPCGGVILDHSSCLSALFLHSHLCLQYLSRVNERKNPALNSS